MAERNKSFNAIILSVKEQGENNRSVCAVSEETGIFYCTLYGGPKSRLKSLVQPFNSGIIYIYEDPQKRTVKITDFDVQNFHLQLKNSLDKLWAGNLACELVLKSKCSGDPKKAFVLLNAVLDGIDLCSEENAKKGLLRFLWRYLCLSGVQPEIKFCSSCGQNLLNSEKNARYIHLTNSFICEDCHNSISEFDFSTSIPLGLNSLLYLFAVENIPPKESRALPLLYSAQEELKNFLFSVIQQNLNLRLDSISEGLKIL